MPLVWLPDSREMYWLSYLSSAILQTKNYSPEDYLKIQKVTITSTQEVPSDTSIVWYAKNSSSGDWEAVTLNTEYTFVGQGSELYIKAELSTSNSVATPVIQNFSLSYITNESSLLQSLQTQITTLTAQVATSSSNTGSGGGGMPI